MTTTTAMTTTNGAPEADAPIKGTPIPFEPDNFTQMAIMASKLSGSGMLPKHLHGQPASVCLVMMRGRELGISPVQSLRMNVINGNVGLPADMMVALVKKHSECEYFRCVERTETQSTWVSKRKGADPIRYTFTMAKAKQAGLDKSDMYRKYPDNMLMWRAASDLCRMEWSELFAGVYSQEELDEMRGDKAARSKRDASVEVETPSLEAHAEVVNPETGVVTTLNPTEDSKPEDPPSSAKGGKVVEAKAEKVGTVDDKQVDAAIAAMDSVKDDWSKVSVIHDKAIKEMPGMNALQKARLDQAKQKLMPRD